MKGEAQQDQAKDDVFEGLYQQDLSDEELIERFSSLVHKIAHNLYRYLKSSVLLEDMIAYGMTGLITAHRRYSEEYEVVFSTYAYYRIRGEILDGCRRSGADLRRGKAFKELIAINEFYEDQLSQPLRDPRTFSDCVQSMRRMVGDATILHYLRRTAGQAPASRRPTQPRGLERRDLRAQFVDALAQLDGKERELLELYYFEEISMQEIGERMGHSKSWVSRMHGRSIDKLRRVLLENEEFCDNYDIIRV